MLHRTRQHRGNSRSNVAPAGTLRAALLRPARHCFALEPRQMFDGAAAAEAAALAMPGTDADERDPGTTAAHPKPAVAGRTSAEADVTAPAAALQQPTPADAGPLARPPVRLAFVDGSLPFAATLAAGFNAGTTVVMLESGRDPWQQMSNALGVAGAGTVAAIDLVSHGDRDTLIIDGRAYGAAELAARTPLLQGWRSHLTAGADLLLYGCKVGADGTASPMLALLAAVTGADVAASTDATASSAQGGNTALEVSTGLIQTLPAALDGLDGPLSGSAITDTSAATTRSTPEDTEVAVSGLGITDSDNPSSLSLQVVTTGGTARVTTLTGLTVTSGANASAAFTLRGTLANINAALASLRYTPALDQNSSAAGFAPQIALTASDLINGGSGSLTVSNFAVIPINDPPDLSTRAPLTVNEGGSASFGLAQLAASAAQLDPDIGTGQQVLAQQMMRIASLPAHGTLTFNNGTVTVGSVVPVASLAGLRYTHNGTDLVATQTASFDVVVNDGGGGSTAATLSINIAPVNVAPTISGAPALLEGQVQAVAPAIDLGDGADTPASSTMVIDNIVNGGQGSLFLDANVNNTVDAGEALTGSVTLSEAQRTNLAAWLKFAHNGAEPNAPGAVAPSFRLTVTDAGGGTGVPSAAVAATITLAVTPNNDDPTLDNAHSTPASALAVGEGTKLNPVTTAMLRVSDADRDPANLTQTTPANRLVYTIGTRPTQGEIQIFVGGGFGPEADGWVVLGNGGRFTQAQVDAGEVRYYQTTNVPNGAATIDSFTFSVRDTALGFDVWTEPANPVAGREGGLRDTNTGPIATRAFHFSIEPLPADSAPRPDTAHTGAPRPPTQGFGGSTITYSFAPAAGMSSSNSPAAWNEGNVGAPDGGYLVTSAMLSYQITWTDNSGTPDPADDVSVLVPPAETVYTLTSPSANGSLQRLVGGSWQAVATYSQFTQAQIDAGRIRFVHDGGEDHVASFGYRVSDGSPNSYSASFGIDMIPLNDRPGAGSGGAVVTEGNGNTVRLGTSAIGMSDADGSLDGKGAEGSADFLWFRLDNLPAAGELQRWNGTGWAAATTDVWLPRTLLTATADGGTSGLRYVHDGSEPLAYPGGPSVTFSFVVRDDLADPAAPFVSNNTAPPDTGGSAQSNQSAPATAAIQVIPVNDPPQIANTPGAADPTLSGALIAGAGASTGVNEVISGVAEGATITIGPAYLTAIDPDHTTVQRQYRIMTAPTLGTLLLGGRALGAESTFTQDDVDNNRLSYRHAGADVASSLTTDALGSYHDKFHFTVSDGVEEDTGAGSPNFNVALIALVPANDKATVAAPAALDVLATGATPVAVTGVSVTDVDLDAIVAVAEEDFIRVEIAVLTAGDAAMEGATLTFTAADPSASARSLVTGKGTNALVLQGTRDEVNAALATLTVSFAADQNSATHKIRVTADDRLYDAGGTLSGGANGGTANTDGSAINAANNRASRDIALRVSNANDAPSIVNGVSYAVSEDVLLTLSGFTLADADSFIKPVTVKVQLFSDAARTTLASAGTQGALTYAGLANVTATGTGTSTVTLIGTLTNVQTALNALRFDNATEYNGPAVGNGQLFLRTTFTDFGHADVPAGHSVTVDNDIAIVPVNDAPVLGVPGNRTLSSGTFIDIGSGFAVQDTKDVGQGANDQITVTVAATVGGVASGAISIQTPGTASIGGDGSATVTVSGTAAAVQAALNSLRYTPVDADLDDTVLMTVTADDRTAGVGNGTEGVGGDGDNTTSGSFRINVSAINDPPVSAAPASLSVSEDSIGNAVAGVSFTDADDFGGNVRVTLAVTQGSINLVTRTGLTVVAGNYGTSSLTVSGTEANLNAGLGSLRYTPTANFHGSSILSVTVNDQGLTGVGGSQSAISTVAITVTPVNDRPTASSATLAATTEDNTDPASVALSTIAFDYSDATDNQTPAGNNTATALGGYAIVGNASAAAQGKWQYDIGGGWVDVPATASDSLATVLPASASVRFLPAVNFNGAPGALSLRLADSPQSAATGVNLGASTGSTGTWSAAVSLATSVHPRNDAPVLSGTVNTTFTEGGAPAALLTGASASDIDLPGAVTFGGGSITVSLDTWRAGDLLSLATGLTGVAGVSGGNGTPLRVSLSTAATPATIGAILNALRFENTSDDPAGHVPGPDDLDRAYTVVLNDGNNVNGAVNAGGAGSGDPALNSNVLTGVITLVPVNDPPVATDDAATLTETTAAVSGNVRTGIGGTLDTDLDHRSGELFVDAIRTGAVEGDGTAGTIGGAPLSGLYGTLVMAADGAYTYTLDTAHPLVRALSSGETLNDSFNYRIADPAGGRDIAWLTITITGVDNVGPAISADDGNGEAAGQATVFESGLTADGPAGESRAAAGTLSITAPSGLATVSVAGTSFTVAQLAGATADSPSAAVDTGEGLLRITGLRVDAGDAAAPTAATVSYVYTLKAALPHTGASAIERLDSVAIAVTDTASAASSNSAALGVRIVDDAPAARPDSAAVDNAAASSLQTSGQLVTAQGPGEVADRRGADAAAAPVIAVSAGGVTSAPGTAVAGLYGQLALSSSGAYTYSADPANAAVAGLAPGSILRDVFTYTIIDTDGDTSTASLTITIRGEAVPLLLAGPGWLLDGERRDRTLYEVRPPRLDPQNGQYLHVQQAVRSAQATAISLARAVQGLAGPPGGEIHAEDLALDRGAEHAEHVSSDGVRYARRLFADVLEPPGTMGSTLRLGTETLFDAFSPFAKGTPAAAEQPGEPPGEPDKPAEDEAPAGAESAESAATAEDPGEAEQAGEPEDGGAAGAEDEDEADLDEDAAAGAAATVASAAAQGFSRQLRHMALERALAPAEGSPVRVKRAAAQIAYEFESMKAMA